MVLYCFWISYEAIDETGSLADQPEHCLAAIELFLYSHDLFACIANVGKNKCFNGVLNFFFAQTL